MVSLIDYLLPEEWKEVSVGERGEGFVEYHVMQRKHTDPNTIAFFLTNDQGDGVTAKLTGTQANKDPIKSVACCEFKIDGENIVGVDICGDVVLKQQKT